MLVDGSTSVMRLQPTATCKPDKHPMAPHAIGFFVPRRMAVWGDRSSRDRPEGRAGIPANIYLRAAWAARSLLRT